MSHFVVAVLAPKGTEDLEAYVDEVLEPYSEHLEVEEHDTECYCINYIASRDARKQIDFNERRDAEFEALRSLPLSEEEFDTIWANFMKKMKAELQPVIEAHPLFGKPDPSCTECKGEGYYETTENPKGHWDWWVIGGRWDGWIFGPERAEESYDSQGNYGDEHHTLENNSRPVSEIPTEDNHYVPFAVIANGTWHQKGEMLMWAVVDNEKDISEWGATVRKLYEDNKDCIAVAVDCHC